MAEIQALCMKCKHDEDQEGKKNMTNITIEEKDGRYSAKGDCPDCGGGMFKFLSEDDAKQMDIEIEHVESE